MPRICRQGYSFSNRGSSSAFSKYCRYLSSPSIDDKQSATASTTRKDDSDKLDVKALADTSSRGIGQVLFLNCPTSGLILLGGLAVGDPYLSVLAATGAGTATATASLAGLDKGALKDGLWGYNGCLVGCATAVFVNPLPAVGWTTAVTAGLATTVVGSAATPFVAAALQPACGSVPQFTLAFNMVTLSMLLRSRPLLPSAEETPTEAAAVTTTTTTIVDVLLHAPWKGISQIFVVESTLSGAAILGGIAYYSRGLAAHTLLGSSIGAATGAMLGADMNSLSIGLWGFNSALTSLGVGVFFVHSPQTVMLSAGGAAATAAVFGAMSTVFGTYGSPCLTLPFCLTMTGCYLLGGAIPGLRLAQAPHSPEKNS
jgi:urea transporter